MPHLNDGYFGEVLRCFTAQRIGLVRNPYGNAGDQMIERATLELFRRHALSVRTITKKELENGAFDTKIDVLAGYGGGSIGEFYKGGPAVRKMMARVSVARKILLPQSAFDPNEDLSAFDIVFARENTSWQILSGKHRDVRLAPDMALSLRLPVPEAALANTYGIFMRRDRESTSNLEGRDPAISITTATDYITAAARFEIVRTNRLHFAIAAALQERNVFLRPGSYHKNRSMFETWLRLFPNITWEEL